VVKTQLWIAVSVYVLVAIIKKRLKLDASLYTILQILSLHRFRENVPQSDAYRFPEIIPNFRISPTN
jgi:hypothetical protein